MTSLKPKYIQFKIIYDRQNKQMIISGKLKKKLKTEFVVLLNFTFPIKIADNEFSDDQLIN